MLRDGVIADYQQWIKDNHLDSELLPIRILKTISGGRSGAHVLKVEYGKRRTLAILKINAIDESAPYQKAIEQAESKKCGDSIAKIIHSCRLQHDGVDEYVVLYELAGDQSEPKMLIDLIEAEEAIEKKTLKEIIDFMFDWKSDGNQVALSPAELIKDELGKKYNDEKFINAYKSIGIDQEYFWIKPNDQFLPNPVLFLARSSENEVKKVNCDLSISHNDFHGGNIILDGIKPKVIDFAECKDDSCIFYDLMYLEFHLLFDYIVPSSNKDLIHWSKLCQDVSVDIYRVSIVKGRGASVFRNVIPVMRELLRSRFDERNNNVKILMLSAAVAVGLNVMRRSANEFQRKAGFIYAACFLNTLIKIHDIKWFKNMYNDAGVMDLSDRSQDDLENRIVANEKKDRTNIVFKYGFLGYDAKVSENNGDEKYKIKKNRFFLDLGHSCTNGAIDIHDFIGGYTIENKTYESTLAVISKMPSLVLDNYENSALEVELVTHIDPDFDCIASVYTVQHLLTHGKLPSNIDKLVEYTEAIDKGAIRIVNGCLNVPFVIAKLIDPVLRKENPQDKNMQIFEKTMIRGVELIDYCMKRLDYLREGEKSLYNYAILSSTNLFEKEYNLIVDDFATYLDEFETPEKPLEYKAILAAGGQNKEVFAIMWDNPPKCMLHKDWARIDYNSPDGLGYTLTFIPLKKEPVQKEGYGEILVSRVIIAVKPEMGVNLKGLGKLLEAAEVKKEEMIFGNQKDLWRSRDRELRRYNEPWCDNNDPWYDGRGHGFTIIDAPYPGSLLTIQEIKDIVLDYAKATEMNRVR